MFLDGVGCGSGELGAALSSTAEQFVKSLLNKYEKILSNPEVARGDTYYGISPFFIQRGNQLKVRFFS